VCVVVTMDASVNVFRRHRWMVRARTLSAMCAGMLRTHLMRLIESYERVLCVVPFLVGGATMITSSERLTCG
jgi:hypothetical protein